MLKSKQFSNKKIVLIDKEQKVKNDRTWCYWEKGTGFFEDIVYRKWDSVSFLSEEFSSALAISPYQYKMIRGVDFYKYCFDEISRHDNVELVYGEVKGWENEKEAITIKLDDKEFRLFDNGTQIFNSIYKPNEEDKKTIRLLQHFKGWLIETPLPSFDISNATMMDFRVHQNHGTSFAYVLPFTETTALIEYTLFTKELLPQDEYDKELIEYIHSFLNIRDYKIKEEEFGVIPMTNEKFNFGGNGWQIGTAGGQTKASSGYTFRFIQKQSALITDFLIQKRSLNYLPQTARRFRWYDSTLLHILYHDQLPGKKIFTQLFKNNSPVSILKFLDNESTVMEELKIISSLPAWPFLKAAIKRF